MPADNLGVAVRVSKDTADLLEATQRIKLQLAAGMPCILQARKSEETWAAWIPGIDAHGTGQLRTEACIDLIGGLRQYARRWEELPNDHVDKDNRSIRDFTWFVMLHTDAELLAWLQSAE